MTDIFLFLYHADLVGKHTKKRDTFASLNGNLKTSVRIFNFNFFNMKYVMPRDGYTVRMS